MSVQILIKGYSKNGRSITLNSYYDSRNCDDVDNLPKSLKDLKGFNNDKFDKFNNHYSVYVNISGSKSDMHFEFTNQCTTFLGAVYKVESFINMINKLK